MSDLVKQSKKEKMEQLNKQLKDLESEADETPEPKEKVIEKKIEEEEPIKLEKPKRPRSQAQIKQFEKVYQRKMEEANKRKVKRAQEEKEEKEQLEKKLIEKAIKLKKKQINRIKVIEELSEDEEVVKESPVKPIMNKPAPVINKPIKQVDPYEAFRLKFKII
jgi:hypothetical protein